MEEICKTRDIIARHVVTGAKSGSSLRYRSSRRPSYATRNLMIFSAQQQTMTFLLFFFNTTHFVLYNPTCKAAKTS